MSAALRLADARVFERVHAALPELFERGHGKARGVTAHDLRHVALVLRVLELEMQTKSELTPNNLLNLIISDRFLDRPPVYDEDDVPRHHASHRVPDSRTRCDAANPLCVYAESVSLSWALAKIKHAYRTRQLLRYVRHVLNLDGALPPLSPASFRGLPLFDRRDVKPTQRLRLALQDYLVMYRASMLAAFEARPPAPDDAWAKAAYAMLLADRAGLTVGRVLGDLRIRSLADVEDSARLDAFIRASHALPHDAQAAKDADVDAVEAVEHLQSPDRVTHVGLFSLASPSSEVRPLAR